jgi:hypothetical protein
LGRVAGGLTDWLKDHRHGFGRKDEMRLKVILLAAGIL